jgi:hypothetical protein
MSEFLAPVFPMPIQVERSSFDPEAGYEYHVCFARSGKVDEKQVDLRVPVQVAVSIGETGELADLSFELPKGYRSQETLTLLRGHRNAQYVEPRVFVVFPGINGDTVILAEGRLEFDSGGRMIGMEISWNPIED